MRPVVGNEEVVENPRGAVEADEGQLIGEAHREGDMVAEGKTEE